MANHDQWTYYTYGGIVPGEHIEYLRYRQGRAEGLNTRAGKWVRIDGKRISRYIENWETDLDKTTRAAMESAIGVPLPD